MPRLRRDSQSRDLAPRQQFLGSQLHGRYSPLDPECAWYAKSRFYCIPMAYDASLHLEIDYICKGSLMTAKCHTLHPVCNFRVPG
jgi:hypothetical protein